jgi:protein-L-isoaspartate(D-aspartate) O-methyltransferase
MRDYAVARRRMVDEQLRTRGITERDVLESMAAVPRHLFVPPRLRHRAYDNCALPIGYDQTISKPFTVGLMTALLELRGHERVLEIGTGSGYQAAILSRLASEVVTVERITPLADVAREALSALGCENVTVTAADGRFGAPDRAPFDAIMVTACADEIPRDIVSQLVDGGYLLLPLLQRDTQVLYRCQRHGEQLRMSESVQVGFVPLKAGVREARRSA